MTLVLLRIKTRKRFVNLFVLGDGGNYGIYNCTTVSSSKYSVIKSSV